MENNQQANHHNSNNSNNNNNNQQSNTNQGYDNRNFAPEYTPQGGHQGFPNLSYVPPPPPYDPSMRRDDEPVPILILTPERPVTPEWFRKCYIVLYLLFFTIAIGAMLRVLVFSG